MEAGDGEEPNYTLCWVEKEDRHKFPELQSKPIHQQAPPDNHNHHAVPPLAPVSKQKPQAQILLEGDGEDDEPKITPPPTKRSQPSRGTKKTSPNSKSIYSIEKIFFSLRLNANI